MSVFRMYFTLLVAASVAGAILHVSNGAGSFNSWRGMGEFVGSTVTLFLIGAFFPTVWISVSRKKARSRVAPTVIGVAALALFAHFSHQGEIINRGLDLGSFTFQPQGCTFSILFPSQPEIRELMTDNASAVRQANFYSHNAFLRAECLRNGGEILVTKEAMMQELREYSTRNGLSDPEYEVGMSSGVVRGSIRGWKMVADKAVTYMIMVVSDGESVMSVMAGGESAGYPQKGISEFLSSVKKVAIRR